MKSIFIILVAMSSLSALASEVYGDDRADYCMEARKAYADQVKKQSEGYRELQDMKRAHGISYEEYEGNDEVYSDIYFQKERLIHIDKKTEELRIQSENICRSSGSHEYCEKGL